ncbi:unnamed protein product [Clavelina lepadiformis]|uniref:Menin n=1 Tax=Clavelina lepadiformis TaxID=159417 RepID=A0ABP0FHB1_CLALP
MTIREAEKSYFPVNTQQSFLDLVTSHISYHKDEDGEPNLVFLSILFGYLEHELTVCRLSTSDNSSEPENDATKISIDASKNSSLTSDEERANDTNFPTLELDIVEGLYEQFTLMIKSQIDRSLIELTTRSGYATKLLCKRVSDVIWNGLLPSYHKDKAHIQSLFSYLTGRQLDCFGLAFVVVAACQLLNYGDVHLVVSGDHAWAACGEDSKEMVEVTWHGRGSEDRRGYTIDQSVTDKSWMYHGGSAVKCDRWMELVAMLTSINPSISIHCDSEELLSIQYQLMRLLYSQGHLNNYPMALGLLCELSESLQAKDLDIEDLHKKSLAVVQTLYDDLHVLPYCSKGHFCLRHQRYKEAIKYWAKAALVVSKYNYGKEDEEIYKEMIDIANDLIPQALKEDLSLCGDADCYRDILRFYDGICLWEEDSSTPVLHSWWARHFTFTIGRFQPSAKESIKITDSADLDTSISGEDGMSRRSSRGHGVSMSSPSASSASMSSPKSDLRSSADSTVSYSEPCSSKLSAKACSSDSKNPNKLQLHSQKMKALKDMLISGKKINSQAVGLLLTAQSQVHFVKRRSNTGDYSMEYGNTFKRGRRSKDFES